jgi:hypothetical protein
LRNGRGNSPAIVYFYVSLSTVIAGFIPATHVSARVIRDLKWVPAINAGMTIIGYSSHGHPDRKWDSSFQFYDLGWREGVSLWHGYRLYRSEELSSMTSTPSSHRDESATFGILLTNIFSAANPEKTEWKGNF